MYEDLPAEVRSQLSKVPLRDCLSVQILEAMKDHGVMSVDEIIVAIWKRFQIVAKRRYVHMRLQTLTDCEEIERTRRGFYRLPKEIT